jgi:hypothetical protein
MTYRNRLQQILQPGNLAMSGGFMRGMGGPAGQLGRDNIYIEIFWWSSSDKGFGAKLECAPPLLSR